MLKNINVECGKRKNYSVDYVSPINFKKKKLLLHPYVMGVLIGDGSIASHNLAFTTNDIEMVDKISEKLPIGDVVSKKAKMCYRIRKKDKTIRDKNGFMVKSETQKALEFYEIHNHLSDAKFIPKDYLLSDVEDRIELLRGLLDTDGFAGGYYIEYTTVSKNLAYDIIELVHSLGGYASVSTKHGTYKKNGKITNCKLVYRVVIQFSKGAENPFGLKRKQDNYNPKRNVIKRFIQSVEYVGEKESQCIMVEDPSQLYITDDYIITHNTTLGIFFLSWVMGKHPDEPNLASAHSDKLTRSFFDGVMSIITDPEYLWADVFPGVQISSVNSKDETIDLGKKKRFKTLTCRSIDGSLTGATRCEGVLYADDLVSGIEEALSLDRMDSLWNKYTNDLKSRKKLNCKEIHIATRWSIHDSIGRIQRQYESDPKARFISIPALTDNDESNFNYSGGVGFDTKYFLDMRNILDDVSWKCLFQNEPIEREGLLYNEDELRRYFELPDREPDAIIGICDTKDKGTDYAFLPVAYKYGQDCYIEDCVCDNGLPEIVDVRLTEILIRHKVKSARFESNSAGGRVAEKIQKEVKSKEGITHITTKFTTANKETKIIINSAWVKEHCLFKDRSKYSAQSDYGKMMKMLCSYSVAGKNKNDDAPDGMAMLAEYIQNLEGNFVSVFKRPF
jgi:predicted phage terminase large subunit-like protein